ncbi:S24 family peptidase [Allosphingosinicella indica]|uniref:Phage repressor protein C, contains Cro/C1-type HTH and peptisase s24 domains n=1 Tax=Allosphingosinicella indica TaxID=941907 RepID=A0A1X7G092_9SPHN|nr:S24 family peptidase [Allosphingosinicella indica]SMF61761.1 Phage repressor protein C, contains Cro/C1-type HTH and peptisase s24 domains [Allosphingosinicella indica]
MDAGDPRAVLERLIRDTRTDYAGLSRLIGRNAAYIQQYIKRGVPRRLAEEDRRKLAQYFGIPESDLGALPADEAGTRVAIPSYDVRASAGPGAVASDGDVRVGIAFDRPWLRRLGVGDPALLSTIRVTGDSMLPLLAEGDEILVDRGDGADRLRDGVYVLRAEDALLVKRVAIAPSGQLSIRSDNPAYPSWPDCDRRTIDIVGRVMWVGRKL